MLCHTCQQDKGPGGFYASNRTRCKECVKESVRANRLVKIDYYRAYDRMRGSMPHRVAARAEYQKTDAYRISHQKALRTYQEAHPDRQKARIKLGNALKRGKIKPWPVCAVPECDQKPEAHHPDYSAPLSVVWLCKRHHTAAHQIARDTSRPWQISSPPSGSATRCAST